MLSAIQQIRMNTCNTNLVVWQLDRDNIKAMDFTQASKPAAKYGQSQSQAQQFYSLSQPMQLTESTAAEFANFALGINNNLHYSDEEDDGDFYECKISGINNEDNKLLTVNKNSQHDGGPKKIENTYYGSIENKLSPNCSEEDPTSPKSSNQKSPGNNIERASLLQTSLRLQKSQSGKSNKKSDRSSSASKIQMNVHCYDESIDKTKIEQRTIKIIPSLGGISRERSVQEGNGRVDNTKKYRIQGPDQIFEQLQEEKDKKMQKKEKDNLSKIVHNNISNTKTMLEQRSQKLAPKPQTSTSLSHASISVPSSSTNNIQLSSSSPITSQPSTTPKHNFSTQSYSLFRLPSSTANTSSGITEGDQNYYHKCKYQVTEDCLVINSNLQIKYRQITKIKLIHTEYNRPEIKINFDVPAKDVENRKNMANFGIRESQNSDTLRSSLDQPALQPEINSNSHTKHKQKDNETKSFVVYMCDCYEVAYMVYSYIIVRKLTLMNANHNQIKLQNLQSRTGSGFQYSISGIILKKSKFLKNWDKRYAQISNFQFKSYRITPCKPNSLSPTMKPKLNSYCYEQMTDYKIEKDPTFDIDHIKQLWTRFEIIEQRYLVMKMFKKSKLQKYEIAIPMADYTLLAKEGNWLFGLAGLLKSES